MHSDIDVYRGRVREVESFLYRSLKGNGRTVSAQLDRIFALCMLSVVKHAAQYNTKFDVEIEMASEGSRKKKFDKIPNR